MESGRERLGRQAADKADEATRKVSTWIVVLARLGYAAYGVVYALIGILAAQAAFGSGGEVTNQEGALGSVLSAPFGRILLALIAFGLLCYAAWRLIQGIRDPDNECDGLKGVVKRGNHIFNAAFHALLAFSAAKLVMGSSGGGGGGGPDSMTATVMQQPFGRIAIGVVGVVIVCAGVYEFVQAYRTKFMEHLKPGEMRPAERRWARRIGRVGYVARGVVFGVIGFFLLVAVVQFDPQEARGLGGALQTLARQPFGPYLLGAVAVGLVAYGLFMFVVARYRRIDPT